MPRKLIDCRHSPTDVECSLAIAGSEDELLRAARIHAIAIHGLADSPELPAQLLAALEDERPAAWEPGRKALELCDLPGNAGCSLSITGLEDELIDFAVAHAVSAHGHRYSPALKAQVRAILRESGARAEEGWAAHP